MSDTDFPDSYSDGSHDVSIKSVVPKSPKSNSKLSVENGLNREIEITLHDEGLKPNVNFRSRLPNDGIPEKLILSWKNINVKAPNVGFIESMKLRVKRKPFEKYRTILNNVNGTVMPGDMIALMGSSGSGKTTLLNVLNFRSGSNLKIKGEIMLNGVEVDATKMSIVSCYVQQDDLFFGTLTVEEHLMFHATLRMGRNTSNEAKKQRIDEVLRQFNLEVCKNVQIGIPGRIKGISGGQMRRLSFASEILTDPMILFCDEPTSGLDSFMAKSIVQCLKMMSDNGKTIICTIHQPSSDIFALFNRICLLAGGKVAYFGTRENALEFFDKSLNNKCPNLTNPADFFMDVLSVDVNNEKESKEKIEKYCEVFENSNANKVLMKTIHETKPVPFIVPKHYTPYKATWGVQVAYLFKRCFLNYFRNYRVVMNDVLMSLVTALLGGIIYFESAKKEDGTCTFNQKVSGNLSTALFYTVTVMTMLSVLAAVMAFPLEIPIFYREHHTSVYRTDAYYFSKILLEVPLYIIIPTLHAITIYYMVVFGCGERNFGLFLFTLILVANCSFALGHVLSIIASSVTMAISLAAPILAIQMLFSGFFLKKANAPGFFTYIKFLSVFNYGYDLLMINQWENVSSLKCEFEKGAELLCKESGPAILNELRIRPKNKPFYICMLIALTILWRLLAFFILSIKAKREPIKLTNTLQKILKKKKPEIIKI